MQKLLLLLLPLVIAACVERDTVPANSAGTTRVETYPSAPTPAPSSDAAQTRLPGRGEGELESRPSTVSPEAAPAGEGIDATTVEETTVDDMPDGSIDAPESSEEERNRASSSDAAPLDPTRDSAIIDESGATGFGGRVMTPESLGDGELRPDDDGSIEPDELPMLPADVVDAGPAMIP